MSEEPVPGADEPLDDADAALLDDLARLFTQVDPPPAHLADLVAFALELDGIDGDVALLAGRAESVGAARSSEVTRSITFAGDSLTVMITVTPLAGGDIRVDGWASPGARLPIELRSGTGSNRTEADEGGRFEFTSVPAGRVQFILHPELVAGAVGARQVVTPAVEL
jgi:hypothetical protein